MLNDDAYPYRFSVMDFEKADRFDAWRAEHTHHDISWRMRDVDIRDANFRGIHLDGLMLGRWHFRADGLSAVDRFAHRSTTKIRKDHLDHYYLRLSLSDGWTFRSDAGTTEVKPGQLALIDFSQQYDMSIASGDVLMLIVPRDYLPISTSGLHGAILDHGLGRLFADYMQIMFHRAANLALHELPSVSASAIDFLSAALSTMPERAEHAQRQIDATLLARVRGYIDKHIDDPRLNVPEICSQVGTSRSRLYRLFEPSGGVAHYIRERRLSKIRRILQSHVGPRPFVADLAFNYGFSSPAQLSRAFKRHFGYTPSEVVDAALSLTGDVQGTSVGRWLLKR